MERAQRLAASPMRAIQQAARIRRRSVDEVLPDAADPASLRRVAARSGGEAVAAPSAPAALAATVPVTAPRETPAAAARPADVGEGVTTSLVLQSLPLAAHQVAEVAPMQNAALAPVASPMPKMVVPQALLSALSAQPQLVTMVEPEIPVRVQADGPRIREVLADLSLRADGTVAEVVLLPPVPRAWQRYITAALEQWRFEPLSAPRMHRVQLVFNAP